MAAPAAPESPPATRSRRRAKIAAEIARDAGKILMQGLGTRPAVGFKSRGHQPGHRVRQALGGLIVERLAKAFPADRIVAEEGTNAAGEAGATRVWYVDPLDGTTNFAHGMPIFSVSIGLCIEPAAGAGRSSRRRRSAGRSPAPSAAAARR